MTHVEKAADEAASSDAADDLALDDAEAAEVTAGDGTTTTDSAYRGRYQLKLGEATTVLTPPTTP